MIGLFIKVVKIYDIESVGDQVVIVVKLTSGLGNQMFEYAYAYALSKKQNKRLLIDALSYVAGDNTIITDTQWGYIRPLALDQFNIPDKIVKSKIPNRLIRMTLRAPLLLLCKKYRDGDDLTLSRNLYLWGYFQKYCFFDEYRDDLIKIFTLRDPSRKFEKLKKRLDETHEKGIETVAVHVRRGDYIKVGAAISCQ